MYVDHAHCVELLKTHLRERMTNELLPQDYGQGQLLKRSGEQGRDPIHQGLNISPTTSYSLFNKQAVTRGLLTKWVIPTLRHQTAATYIIAEDQRGACVDIQCNIYTYNYSYIHIYVYIHIYIRLSLYAYI